MNGGIASLKTSNQDGGFVVVILALSALVLVMFAGFAVDLGSWYLTASRLQRAADAAALAGADALPDPNQAASAVTSAYNINGYTNSGPISITQTETANTVETTLTDHAVPTYFSNMFMGPLTISRKSEALRNADSPTLGSPYNVLGSGNLSIPGIPTQNFWLAINAPCAPAEDGDLLSAMWDANKVGIDNTTGKSVSPSAQHVCGGNPAVANPSFNAAGYSYYVNVPSVAAGGSVAIKVYNPSYNVDSSSPDRDMALANDPEPQWLDTAFLVYQTDGTTNQTHDVSLVQSVFAGYDSMPGSQHGWVTLYNVTQPGLYRVEVLGDSSEEDGNWSTGVHAFSLMADRSWSSGGCDSRTDTSCPRIYSTTAESVYNGLPASGSSDFYFAEVPAGFAGSDINAYLWDPGEGVTSIQFIAPDGTPLHFDWTASPACAANPSGANVVSLPTQGTCPSGPARANLSDNDMFNDRLVAATVHLPVNYAAMVSAAGGDDYLRLRYTESGASADRTTWGVTLPPGVNDVPRITSPGS